MKNIKETLLVIVTVIIIILSIGIFNAKEKEKAQKNETSLKLTALRNSLTKLLDDVKTKEKVKSEFENKIDELTKEAASLEVQIAQIKKISDDAEKELADVETAISAKQEAAKGLLSEKNRLIATITSAESEGKDLEKRLAALQEAKDALERHLKKMIRTTTVKETVTSPKVEPEVTTEAAGEPEVKAEPSAVGNATSLEGEVLVVNREFNFIVVNLGKKNGLKEGDRLGVYDGEKLLGEVSVETVRENISAASGGKNLDAYRLRAGNKVIRS